MLKRKKVMIFGGTGSLGKTLVRRLIDENVVIVFSRDEAKQWTLKNECIAMEKQQNLFCEIGDIRDADRVRSVIKEYQPHVVIIASALKQIGTCEMSPMESIKTNIVGIENVVSAVSDLMASSTVCMVSTDKACSPINVYGMCKSIAERVVLEYERRDKSNKYVAVRYGNVLESRGSIIPLFKYQAKNNAELTLTHNDMTRFVMTLEESVDLIQTAIVKGSSGETWIPRLPSMRIRDLAEIFAEMHNKPIKVTGIRPGEKIHELLVNDSESFRTYHAGKYMCLRSVFDERPLNSKPEPDYSSGDSPLSKEHLRKYLDSLGVLDSPIDHHVGKSIEEIRTV